MDARRLMGRAIKDHHIEELMELVEEKGFGIDVVVMEHTTPKIALLACVEAGFLEGFQYLKSRGAPSKWIQTNTSFKLLPGVNSRGEEVPLSEFGHELMEKLGVTEWLEVGCGLGTPYVFFSVECA